jgi:hypothetical protein
MAIELVGAVGVEPTTNGLKEPTNVIVSSLCSAGWLNSIPEL